MALNYTVYCQYDGSRNAVVIYGRGLKYQIQIDEEKCEIVALINPKDLWVM